jgi:uncharacterized membrane protein
MSKNETSVDVDVPIRVAYDQWTQFETFPQFMEGVKEIRQLDDRRTHWVTEIAGVTREFDAEITEQHPEERVAWATVDGPKQAGVVTFHKLNDNTTRVMLQLDIEPEGITETVGDKLGFISRRAKGDMERFKEFIEQRGNATGAWRGDVPREG